MKRFLYRLLSPLTAARAEDDLTREMASHLTLLEDEYRRRGLTAHEARLAARRAMGSVALAKDLHRDARSFPWVDDLRQDVRHAVRGLRRAPGLAVSIAVILALGIGAATTMGSIAYGVLLRPLPYPSPDRLVRVWQEVPGGTVITPGNLWLSSVTADAWSGRSRTIEALGTYASRAFTLDLGTPTRVPGGIVSPGLFDVLRVSPAVGRFFVADDARPGACASRSVHGASDFCDSSSPKAW